MNVKVTTVDTELQFAVQKSSGAKALFDQVITTTGIREVRYNCDQLQGPPYILDRLFNFLSFYHLSKRISKQMIHQLKGPIKGYFIHEKKWAWHHPGGGHAPLTEKALLLLKLVWSLP